MMSSLPPVNEIKLAIVNLDENVLSREQVMSPLPPHGASWWFTPPPTHPPVSASHAHHLSRRVSPDIDVAS